MFKFVMKLCSIRTNGCIFSTDMKTTAMKNTVLTICLFILVQGWSVAQTKITDADISFYFVSKDVEGSIGDFKSKSVILPDDLTESSFEGTVAVETLKTGIFLRDWALKGGKYFDEDKYPNIGFVSNEVVRTEQGYKVTGYLTIKGTTKTVEIDFTENNGQLTGTTSLYTSDYGIEIKDEREKNLVRVNMVLTLGN